ncbi:type II toxin-antitoxin system RelE/ParE family toxin [Methylobacterium sp. NEAU 140]|uniref:type II toxin-antitoxin system RelE/ParE family toxin n=1 Tax=Methylobacterium sp. NEAU 140 TaxID=3064945 RepID=UPI0027327910|nr:type II toxin-antitoxin system RelE/ParE family toxin [Methylobacterium sp. NEAU 140]MDP4021548.1 type II toxin-antitoxin system RelE/ParE family toxin [Methylobacterium sp. NEAU 140]
MPTIRQTQDFAAWFAGLRDRQAKARIDVRIRRLSLGNPGQMRVLSGGVAEMKIDYGPGYRIYFIQKGAEIVILLCGGDKRTQERDIERALAMAQEV